MANLLEGHKLWADRIKEARENRGFTAEDRECAAGWACCAVGENLMKRGKKMPRTSGPTPYGLYKDYTPWGQRDDDEEELLNDYTEWGCEFSGAVSNDDFDYAEKLLRQVDEASDAVVKFMPWKEIEGAYT